MSPGTLASSPTRCATCTAALPAGARDCPACHALVHAAELDRLSAEARSREAGRDRAAARALWQQALALLPAGSTQSQWVRGHLAALPPDPARPQPNWVRRLGPLGPLALVLLKAKGLLLAIFKLKFLFSLFSFVGLYWALYGWKFGVGFAASILIHEMGHYVDIRRRGLPAEMPIFLPGLGAYVRWQALGVSARERAQISLAGPLAGWFAAAICALLYLETHNPFWGSLARVGAAMNLLNLIPIWILDGGQAANALGRTARAGLLAAALGIWFVSGQGLFLLVAAGALWRLFGRKLPMENGEPAEGWSTLLYYTAVMAALAILLHALPGLGLGYPRGR
jgi:Zn-dependent protease